MNRKLHEAALRMARRCRFIIQACLREEEWRDADREFYTVILEGLTDLERNHKPDRHLEREI